MVTFASLPTLVALLLFQLSVAQDFPRTIQLPDGFDPSGVIQGYDTKIYACNRRGQIYLFDVKSGTGVMLNNGGEGREFAGITLDYRSSVLWVAGGSTGLVYAVSREGKVLEEWRVAPKDGEDGRTDIRSVINSPYRIFFLDAYRPQYYWLPVGTTIPGGPAFDGRIFPNETARTVRLGGEWQHANGEVNANGVEWTERFEPEDYIHIINRATGKLYVMPWNTTDIPNALNIATEVKIPNTGVPGGLSGADQLKFDSVNEEQLYVLIGNRDRLVVLGFPNVTNPFEATYLDTFTDGRFNYPASVGEYGSWLFLPDSLRNTNLGPDERLRARYNVNRIRRWFRSESDGSGPVGDPGQVGSNSPPAGTLPTALPSLTAPPPPSTRRPSPSPLISADATAGSPVSLGNSSDPSSVDDNGSEGISPSPSGAPQDEAGNVQDQADSDSVFSASNDPELPPEEGSRCFPADAMVELESGISIPMHALNIGDRVRVDPWERRYSEVFMFTHRRAESINKFVKIEAADRSSLMLTPGHYLYVNGHLAAAETARVGDRIETSKSSYEPSVILSVGHVTSTGLYNPQTTDGDILVNGVRASTFTRAVEPRIAKVLLLPLKAMHRVTGNILRPMFSNLFTDGSPWLVRLIPSGQDVYLST